MDILYMDMDIDMDILYYMNILDTYLNNNDCTIYTQEDAQHIYKYHNDTNIELFENMCGEMADQLVSLVDTYNKDDDPDSIILLITKNNIPISIFHGTIEDNKLISDITCSSGELKKGGMFLRFYAVLLAKKINSNITELTGGISGGIPALKEDDTYEIEKEKKDNLKTYHLRHGATLNDDGTIFTYTLTTVQEQILELFQIPTVQTIKTKTKTNKRKTKTKTQKRKNIKSKRLRYTKRKKWYK